MMDVHAYAVVILYLVGTLTFSTVILTLAARQAREARENREGLMESNALEKETGRRAA